MTVDAHGRSHRPSGLPQGYAGTYDGSTGASGYRHPHVSWASFAVRTPALAAVTVVPSSRSATICRRSRSYVSRVGFGMSSQWSVSIMDGSPGSLSDAFMLRQNGSMRSRISCWAPSRGV